MATEGLTWKGDGLQLLHIFDKVLPQLNLTRHITSYLKVFKLNSITSDDVIKLQFNDEFNKLCF